MELKIASWNVKLNGLSGKIKLGNAYCNEMRDLIRSFDIVGLVETRTTVQSNIKLPGYSHLSKHRRKRCKKGRPSGGLVLYFRKKLKDAISLVGGAHEDMMWIKVDGVTVGLNRDLYLGLVYIKPGKNKDIFHQLDRDIVQYSSLGDIMLLGDFNGRTGSSDDFIRNDSSKDVPLPPQYAEDSNIT